MTKYPRDKCDIHKQWIGVAVTKSANWDFKNWLLGRLFRSLIVPVHSSHYDHSCNIVFNRKSLSEPVSLALKTVNSITILKNQARFQVLTLQSCCCLFQLSKNQALSRKAEEWGSVREVEKKTGRDSNRGTYFKKGNLKTLNADFRIFDSTPAYFRSFPSFWEEVFQARISEKGQPKHRATKKGTCPTCSVLSIVFSVLMSRQTLWDHRVIRYSHLNETWCGSAHCRHY